MPLHSASYFAGVGTVVATMAIGFGGGVMLTDAFVGKSEKAPTRIERRAAPLAEATPVVATAPAPAQQSESQQAAPAAPQPPVAEQKAPQQAAVSQQQPPAQQQQAAAPQTMPQAQQPPIQPPPAQSAQSTPRGQTQFENSMGQMREVHLNRPDADAKKAAAAERRKQERRKWAERRKREMEQVDELTAVTEKVKQIDRSRERDPVRSFAAESRPPAPPVFGLFSSDEDD